MRVFDLRTILFRDMRLDQIIIIIKFTRDQQKSMKVWIVIILIFALAVSQGENQEGQGFQNNEQGFGSGNFGELSPEEQYRYNSMRRTACLVLSRHYSNSRKDELDAIIKSTAPEQQQKFINKMYTKSIEICENTIQPDEVQQLFVENPAFDATVFFPVFATVDYNAISKESYKLSKNQEGILQYIKQFDEEMEIRKEEQQAEEQKLADPSQKNDIKLFGFSTKDFGGTTKMIYVSIFVLIVGGLIFWGIRQLSKDDPKNKKKDKKRGRGVSPKSPKKE